MNAIEFTCLTKTYGKARGVTELSFSVPEGGFCGFIGPNGAGKSTSIRAMLGLIAPTSGSVNVLGQETRVGKAALREVGYLPSEISFPCGMRVRDVLRLSADLRGLDCSAEAKRLCDRLELDATRRVDALSLGNRKKVGIVCALQHRPRLCVLDEPTSGLDPLMQRAFYELLLERNAAGATVFLSSHVLSEVQRYCRQAAVIREGRLLAYGDVEALGHTEVRRVTLRGVPNAPDLPGVRGAAPVPDGVTFLYSGEPRALLSALAQLPVADLAIAEPDLEEVFLHFYAKEETSHGSVSA